MASELVKAFIPEFAVEGRVVEAEQKFHRKLKQWEFSIEKQKLFREDIRDLVELTVGRMDIYHLVGALLLGFCMTFYCENEMLSTENPNYPTWLISLFMISNFCAIGFLTLAVWLSMHASVASHSVGVRLLLRLVRPDVPNSEMIENLQAPLVSLFGTAEVQEPSLAAATAAPADERNHFKEFLQRQRVWMCYDAYSRVCMSLGMNAMMIALTYYLVGRISEKNTVSAISSVLGVQLLSLALLALDIRHDRPDSSDSHPPHGQCFLLSAVTDWREAAAVFLLLVFPPLFSLFLVLLWPHIEGHYVWHKSMRVNTCLSTISFVLHACWLEYLYIKGGQTTDDLLPRRLRAVQFMDVMSPDEMELGAEDARGRLRQAHDQLQVCMVSDDHLRLERLRDDLATEIRNARHVRSMAFATECPELHAGPQEAREGPRDSGLQHARLSARAKREVLDREILRSEKLLDVYYLWKTGPQVLANAQALQAVRGLKEEEQLRVRSILEQLPGKFSRCCELFRDGIERREAGQIKFATEDPLPVVATVREDPATRVCTLRWYCPEDPLSVLAERPVNRRSTTFDEAMSLNLSWDQTFELVVSGGRSADEGMTGQTAVAPQQGADVNQGDSGSAQLPQMVDRLPRDVVRTFMRGCGILWLIAAAAHLSDGLIKHEVSLQSQVCEPTTIVSQQLNTEWPAPAGLFQVGALHCVNDSMLLISSRFSLWGAHWQSSGTAFSEMKELSNRPAGAILCDSATCNVLAKSDGEWNWVPLIGSLGSTWPATSMPVPAYWRLVTAMWENCSGASSSCESALLAGWTGAEIEVAEAQRDSVPGSWRLQKRFAVPADVTTCGSALKSGSSCLAGNIRTYADVRALQLGQGRTLAVLLGEGHLHGWDLRGGTFLGQWRIGHGNYTSMCHGTHQIVLAQRGGRLGPKLQVAELPLAFSQDSQLASVEHDQIHFLGS